MWMHATDGADAGSIAALTQELARLRGEPVYGLVTSADVAPLPPAVSDIAIHQLAPGETAGSVTRFLDHWKPDVGVILGPPDRPLLFADAHARGIPMYLASPRRGELAPGGRVPLLAASLLDHFEAFLLPSAAEAQAFHGAAVDPGRTHVTGPLSDTALALPCSEDALSKLKEQLGSRPIWLASRVTLDELDAVEAAQRRTIRAAHRLLVVIIPRVLEDGPDIAGALETQGWSTAVRSRGEPPSETVQVYIADAGDEMGLWYRLAPITFLGGTLSDEVEPADPFEPAALGSAIVHGPVTGAAMVRFDRLSAADASVQISDGDALGDAIFRLLSPDKAAVLAHAGWGLTSESAHVVERLAEMIDIRLDQVEAE